MARVLVAGCGYVGAVAADLFHAAGWNVVGWTSSLASAERLGEAKPYGVASCDVTDRAAVATAAKQLSNDHPAPLDVLVISVSSGGGDAERYRAIYLEGTRNLLAALDARRVVYTSSTSVYPQTDGGWVDEKSPANPSRETGKILRETEDLVLAHGGGVVARLAGIYGPGRSTTLRKFLAGEAVIEGGGERWLNQIHRDDAAAAVMRLAQTGAPVGVYNVVDDAPCQQVALYAALAEHFGRAMPETGPINPGRKRPWTNKRVSNARLRALGWEPTWKSYVAWAVVQGTATDENPSLR